MCCTLSQQCFCLTSVKTILIWHPANNSQYVIIVWQSVESNFEYKKKDTALSVLKIMCSLVYPCLGHVCPVMHWKIHFACCLQSYSLNSWCWERLCHVKSCCFNSDRAWLKWKCRHQPPCLDLAWPPLCPLWPCPAQELWVCSPPSMAQCQPQRPPAPALPLALWTPLYQPAHQVHCVDMQVWCLCSVVYNVYSNW